MKTKSREHRDNCKKCGGRRRAIYHGPYARFEAYFPSACVHTDKCEEELLKLLQIEPARDGRGEIVR
jgi:hypothetical protein